MEVVSKSFFEIYRQTFVEEVKEGIYKWGGYGYQTKVKYSLNEYRFILLDDWFYNLAI
jgi:hypothetical protein